MTGTIVALAADSRTGKIRTTDDIVLEFSATSVLGDFDALGVGHRVSFEVERDRHHTAVSVFREPLCASAAAKKSDALPDLRYAGFRQAENVRSYRFHTLASGRSVQYCVTVDITLLLKHHIGVQEAPALCLHKLAADLKACPDAGKHELCDDDLCAFASSRAAALQRKKPKHSFAGRRGSPPPCPSNPARV